MNLLGAKVLYSDHTVTDLLDPWIQGPRTPLERHHLFPNACLRSQGITRNRDINQIANFALVESGDNAGIAHQRSSVFVPKIESRFSRKDLERMYHWHAYVIS